MRRVVALMIGVLAFYCGVNTTVSAQESKRIEPPDYYVRSAKVALNSKEYERAERNLRTCLENYPDNYQAHFLMGAIWGDKEQIDSMVYEFNQARIYAGKNLKKIEKDMVGIEEALWEKNFNAGVAYINIADSLENAASQAADIEEGKKKRDNAGKALEESARGFYNCTLIQPDEFRGWFNLGLVYDRQREYQKAVEVYKISEEKFHRVTMLDSTTNYYDTTLFFTGPGEETELFKEIKKTFKKLSEDLRTRYNGLLTALGGVYFELGEYENTIIVFRRLLGFSEEDLTALEYIGNSFQQLGNNEEALKWIEFVIRKNPDDKDRLYNVGAHWYNAGVDDKKIYESRLREKLEGSNDPNINAEIAKTQEKYQSEFTKSLQFIDRVTIIDPTDAESWKLKAVALFFLDRIDEAIPALEKARELNPEEISLCQILAECWRQKGDVDKVLKLTEECGLGK